VSVTGQQIVDEAKSLIGDPYVYGAAGPSTFDCSGLVQYVLSKLGAKSVPRTSEAQWGWVQKITRSQLQPGDLIFEQWPGDNAAPGHVVIYAGGGKVIEAPQPGQSVLERSWSPSETTITGYGRPAGITGSSTGGGGLLGGLLSLALPQPVLDLFSAMEKIAQSAMWIINPVNWARIVAGVFGFLLLGAGLITLGMAA
jgi:hypothetical protein